MRPAIFVSAIMCASSLAACQPAAQTETNIETAAASRPVAAIKHADANAASAILSTSNDVRVLDIRTPAEFTQGHIAGATMIDFKSADFAQEVSKLDRNTPYVVHCASGGRSTKSLEIFKELGFTNVTHLDGGIRGWKAAGLPLTSAN